MADVKETKEALVAAMEVSLFLCDRLKDGLGVDDVLEVYNKLSSDEDFKAKIVAAYDGYKLIPAEVKDIDMSEGFELMMTAMSYVPKFIECFKKEEKAA